MAAETHLIYCHYCNSFKTPEGRSVIFNETICNTCNKTWLKLIEEDSKYERASEQLQEMREVVAEY